jgi:hypothetical protein
LSRLANLNGDSPPPLLQHGKDGPISEPVKESANDAKADDLGNQLRPIHAECPGDLFDLPASARVR